MTLGEKLKYLRKQKNITQTEFADMLYVTRQAVQKWESDVAYPDVNKLPDISKIFDVSVDSLLDENIDETTLLKQVVKIEPSSLPQKETSKQKSMLDYLLLIPFGLGIAILIGMAYMFGAMLVGVLFSFSIGSFAYGIFSIVNIFFNLSGGTGAILLCISFSLLGIGLTYPIFLLAKLWLNKYKQIVKKLNALVKKLLKKGGSNEN